MGLATEAEVRGRLEGYLETFGEIWKGAWQDWLAAERGYWRCNRSRATFMWEQAMERAHKAFDGDPRISIQARNETFWFLLDGCLVFRFKKGDDSGMAANLPTQAVLAFYDPEQELPGLPEVIRVDIVYILNKVQTAISDVSVVCRDRDHVLWMFSVFPHQSNVVSLPPREESTTNETTGLVRPKVDRGRKDAGDAT